MRYEDLRIRRNAETKICGRRIADEEMRDEEMPDEDLSGHDLTRALTRDT